MQLKHAGRYAPMHRLLFILTVAAFALATFTGVDVVWIIIAGGLFGVIYQSVAARKSKKAKEEDENK